MNLNFKSPNFDNSEIPVEFLIIHYTGCDLKKTLQIFMDPQSKVAAHFVIDEAGEIFDLGGFLKGPILKGAHAGKSKLSVSGKDYEAFNGYSIGVELVNLNGNIFEYPESQVIALQNLILKLRLRFPKLNDPERIVGHEHIAYWRGKSDPGLKFDWRNLFANLKMEMPPNHDFHICDKSDLDFLKSKIDQKGNDPDFWPSLSLQLEQRIQQKEAKRFFYSYREFKVDDSSVVPKLTNELPKCMLAGLKIKSPDELQKLEGYFKLNLSKPSNQPLIIMPDNNLNTSNSLRKGPWLFEFALDHRSSEILIVKARFKGKYASSDESLQVIAEMEKAFQTVGLEKHELEDKQLWEFSKLLENQEQFFKSI